MGPWEAPGWALEGSANAGVSGPNELGAVAVKVRARKSSLAHAQAPNCRQRSCGTPRRAAVRSQRA